MYKQFERPYFTASLIKVNYFICVYINFLRNINRFLLQFCIVELRSFAHEKDKHRFLF